MYFNFVCKVTTNSCFYKIFLPFSLLFHKFFVSLPHRLLAHPWAAGGHIYEKDVFERLSLWTMNLANSYHRNRQII